MRDFRGFTLIELMVTIAVLAIIMSIAAPSFTNILQSNRSLAVSEDLMGAVQLARSEAVKRRQPVVVCRRNSAGTQCESGTDWANGWLVQVTGGPVLKLWDASQGMVLNGPNAGVTFISNGMVTANGAFSVTTANCSIGKRTLIGISATGNTTMTKAACQ